MLDHQNLKNLKSPHFNQQFNSKFNNPQVQLKNKPPPIKTHIQSMNQPFKSFKQTNFSPNQIKPQAHFQHQTSSHPRPPLSPKQQSHIKNAFNLQLNIVSESSKYQNQDINLEINSAKNSQQNDDKTISKQEGFIQSKQKNQLEGGNSEFPLALNQKMITLQNKSNRLIQKVLAIQQQIQKYAEVQQKQLRTIGLQTPSSPLLQTKSLLHKKEQMEQFDPIQVQHQQSIRKMNILGKNKVKMIQNLEIQIQNLEQNILDPELKKMQDIQEKKKQIDNKFVNYYKHKNNILKQSKSQKFSFKHLKYLTKQNKYDKSDCGDQIIETFEGNQNSDNLQTQLKKLKEQFSSYQQRTSKQLQNYKERLNQNILEKQILKKQLQKQKYDNLKEKIFNKNKPMKTSRIISPQKTARDLVEAKFGQRTSRQLVNTNFAFDIKFQGLKPSDQVTQNIAQLMNLPKTDQLDNNEEPQFENLEQFKDEVSMRYIEENEEIQSLQEKIKDMDQIIEDLRSRLEKGHEHFINETDELKSVLELKEQTLIELSDINQCNTKQIEDLKNEINDMNNYIFQCKQQNQLQNQEIQEYKNVIEQFVEEVKNLRNQLGENLIHNDQLHQQIQEAEKINRLCQNQINQLQKENQSFKNEIQKLENQLKLREAKQRYTEALLLKQKIKEKADNSFISEQNTKIQTQTSSSSLPNQTIKELKEQNQEQLDLQRIQFDKVLKQRELKIQQLEQNLDQVKNQISQKVEQQVNEGIRTFLRYRKHTNHMSHEIFKFVVLGKKIYNGDEFKSAMFDINFKGIKMQKQKNVKVFACRADRSEESYLSLRKLIDLMLNSRSNSIRTNLLLFKLEISLKLIQFAIELMHQQGNSQETSSRSTKSSKKLPSLHPQSIYVIEQSESGQLKSESEREISQLSTEQRFQRFERDVKNYQFIYFLGNNKDSERKKDKNLVYLSPEVLLSMNESEPSYCWTLGIIIDEILNNRPFYKKIDGIVTRKDNYKYQGTNNLEEETRSDLKDILERMVRKNFKERPSLNVVYECFSKIMVKYDKIFKSPKDDLNIFQS